METTFEKLQRSVPVNRASAVQIAHTPAEVFERLGNPGQIKYVQLARDGTHPIGRSIDVHRLERLRSEAQRAIRVLGLRPSSTRTRPFGLEFFAWEENRYAVYKVMGGGIGRLECTELGGKVFFRHTLKRAGLHKVYDENLMTVSDQGRAPKVPKVPFGTGMWFADVWPLIKRCIECAPQADQEALHAAINSFIETSRCKSDLRKIHRELGHYDERVK